MLKRLFRKKPKTTETTYTKQEQECYTKQEQECIELSRKINDDFRSIINDDYTIYKKDSTLYINETYLICCHFLYGYTFNEDFTIQEIKKVLNHAVEQYERLKKIKEDDEQEKIKNIKSQIEKLC